MKLQKMLLLIWQQVVNVKNIGEVMTCEVVEFQSLQEFFEYGMRIFEGLRCMWVYVS